MASPRYPPKKSMSTPSTPHGLNPTATTAGSKTNRKLDKIDEDKAKFLKSLGDSMVEDALYPQELNDHLIKQITTLSSENSNLRKCIFEKNAEIKEMSSIVQDLNQRIQDVLSSSTGTTISSKTAGIIGTRITDICKQNRHLVGELEMHRSRCSALERKLIEAESEVEEMKKKNYCACGQSHPLESKAEQNPDEIRELSGRLSVAQRKLSEERNKNSVLIKEIQVATLCLQQEIGEKFTSMKELQKEYENGAWKGRAQQVIKLHNKITELEAKLDMKTRDLAVDKFKKKNDAVIMDIEQKRRERIDHAARKLSDLRTDLDDSRVKLDGARSRVRILECECTNLRQKVKTLLDKSNHDDLLVKELNKKITALNEYYQQIMQDSKRQISKLQEKEHAFQQDLDNGEIITKNYKNQIEEKVRKIEHLKSVLSKYEDCSLQKVFYLPMKSANENEVSRLAALVSQMNSRLERERDGVINLENRLLKLKEVKKHLKKQLWRIEIENKELRESIKPARLSLLISKANGKRKRESGGSYSSRPGETITAKLETSKSSRSNSRMGEGGDTKSIEKQSSFDIPPSGTSLSNGCKCEATPNFSSSVSSSLEEESKRICFEHSEEVPEPRAEFSEMLDKEFLKNKLEISDEKIKLLEDRMKMLADEKAEDLDCIYKMLEFTKEQFAQALQNFRNDPRACTCDNYA